MASGERQTVKQSSGKINAGNVLAVDFMEI
jgi:hypothetical protein